MSPLDPQAKERFTKEFKAICKMLDDPFSDLIRQFIQAGGTEDDLCEALKDKSLRAIAGPHKLNVRNVYRDFKFGVRKSDTNLFQRPW